MRALMLIGLLSAALSAGVAMARECMVDPDTVKPKYRQAAIKRAAEQKKLAACQKEASEKTLLPRYRVAFLTACIDN